METRADGNAFHDITNHTGTAASSNNGIDTRTTRHISSLQFGAHPTGSQPGNAVSSNRAQGVVNAVDIFNQLRLRVIARVGGKQPLLIGEQQQFIRTGQNRGQRGEIIVVANFDFSRRHRIVLVNDRNDVVIQQRTQSVARIQEAFPVFHVRAGQQHLAHVNTVDREQLFPQLNQSTLPYRRQQLFRSDGRGEFGIAQMFAPGSNSARRDNHNTVTCGMKLCALADKFNNVGAIKAARSAC
ncbi:hypothetical protein D3C71_1108980 [compost metagenome]